MAKCSKRGQKGETFNSGEHHLRGGYWGKKKRPVTSTTCLKGTIKRNSLRKKVIKELGKIKPLHHNYGNTVWRGDSLRVTVAV